MILIFNEKASLKMLMIISNAGAQCGRYTRISPDGNIVLNLLAKQGIEGRLFVLTAHMTMAMAIISILALVYFKGHKAKKGGAVRLETEKLTRKQVVALVVFVLVVLCVIVLKKDSGFMGIVGAVVLILIGVIDEKSAFKTIPWNIIMMVAGVGMLMNIVIISGGIDTLTSAIAALTSPVTAGGVSCMTASVMSWFSSTLGVVVPTLTPAVSKLAAEIGGNVTAIGLLSSILIGSSSACFSPASYVGGVILSTVVGHEKFKGVIDENKTFVVLFIPVHLHGDYLISHLDYGALQYFFVTGFLFLWEFLLRRFLFRAGGEPFSVL